MTEHIKCSEENAYSVAGHNFDKENFVESNDSGPSDYSYMIPAIVIIIVGLTGYYLKLLRDTKYLLSTRLSEIQYYTQEYPDNLYYMLEYPDNLYYMLEYPDNGYYMPEPPNNEYLYLRTEQMQSDLKSLGLITDLPECITRASYEGQEANWNRCFDPPRGENAIVRNIVYTPSDLRASEFELLIKDTATPPIGNEFTLAEVYTHFCYIYAAIYNHYVIPQSEDKEEHVKHLQNILYSIQEVEDHLKVEEDKKDQIIVRIKLVKELDTKLLAFIRQIFENFYIFNCDEFDIEFYKTKSFFV